MSRSFLIFVLVACGCISPPPAGVSDGTTDAGADGGTQPEPDSGTPMLDTGNRADAVSPRDMPGDPPDAQAQPDADGVITIEFQDGVSPTADYAGTQDADIDRLSPDSNNGDDSDIESDEDPAILVKWDTSAIPTTATVVEAHIEITANENPNSGQFDVYFVNRPWLEDEVTWNSASSAEAWEIPGCQGDTDRSRISVGTIGNEVPFEQMQVGPNELLRERVAGWVTEPSRNHGIIIQKYEDGINGLHISSRESTAPMARPNLVVKYRP